MILQLARDTDTGVLTLGILSVNGKKWHSMERPWIPDPGGALGGKKYESCVPLGTYRVRPRTDEKFGKHFILSNPSNGVYENESDIPAGQSGRSLCLIHPGNYVHDVLGCICIGKDRQAIAGPEGWMVINSRDAMNELRTVVGSNLDLQLVITGVETADGL